MGMEINDTAIGKQTANLSAADKPGAPHAGRRDFLESFQKLPEQSYRESPNGLKVAMLSEGTGTPLAKGMSVTVRYTGWTADGKKFDSTQDRAEPFEFTLGAGRVIQGWEEGLVGIKPGERRQLIIPANLAYGNRQVGEIPPGAVLVFNIEAVSVTPPPVNTKGTMSVVA
jgi:FKBP-type peptidyl-prolyl cis-trans isomerase